MLIIATQDQHLNCYVLSWTEVILFKYNNFQIQALTSPHVASKINWAYAVFSQAKVLQSLRHILPQKRTVNASDSHTTLQHAPFFTEPKLVTD